MTDETRLPGYDAVIPARVLYDQELPDKAKLLYGVVRNLAHRDGYCWAWDKTLAAYFGVSESCVSENLRRLEARRHILREVIRDEETKQVLERRIWIDRTRFLGQDPDLPPSDIRGTPPSDSRGTPPSDICGEKINKKEAVEREDPPVVPPGGRRKKKPLPDWKPERFDAFWKRWPKVQSNVNQSKADARRAWNQLRADDDLLAYMGEYLMLQEQTEQWKNGVAIPYASTWIRKFSKPELPDMETLRVVLDQAPAPAGWAEDPEVMSDG